MVYVLLSSEWIHWFYGLFIGFIGLSVSYGFMGIWVFILVFERLVLFPSRFYPTGFYCVGFKRPTGGLIYVYFPVYFFS